MDRVPVRCPGEPVLVFGPCKLLLGNGTSVPHRRGCDQRREWRANLFCHGLRCDHRRDFGLHTKSRNWRCVARCGNCSGRVPIARMGWQLQDLRRSSKSRANARRTPSRSAIISRHKSSTLSRIGIGTVVSLRRRCPCRYSGIGIVGSLYRRFGATVFCAAAR